MYWRRFWLIFLHPFMAFVNYITPGDVAYSVQKGAEIVYPNIGRHIANLHTMFNIINTLIFLPFLPLLAKLCEKIIKDDKKEEKVEDHEMHSEHFYIKAEDAEKINKAKKEGHRVIAVGTTSCRVLESIADENGMVHETEGDTQIFIYPGYKFKCLDGLITNFHLPQSTLLMLVSALAGKDFILKAYNEAVNEKYRFFSFGDAMFIK